MTERLHLIFRLWFVWSKIPLVNWQIVPCCNSVDFKIKKSNFTLE